MNIDDNAIRNRCEAHKYNKGGIFDNSLARERERGTSDGVVVGEAGDGAGEDRERVREAAGEGGQGSGYTHADCGGGAAVEAEDDVGPIPAHRRLHLKVPHLAVPVSLHRHPPQLLSLPQDAAFDLPLSSTHSPPPTQPIKPEEKAFILLIWSSLFVVGKSAKE